MNNENRLITKEPATLIVVIGMPGSGKSTYIEQLVKDDPTLTVYDDYQGRAYANNHDPRLSKHFGPLVAGLLAGKSAVVSDIAYCVPNELGAFLGAILSTVSNVVLDFRYFANDPEQCKKNVLQRNRQERLQKEIELIDILTKQYNVVRTDVLPVYIADPG